MPNTLFENNHYKLPSQNDTKFCYLLIKDMSSLSLYVFYGLSILILSIFAIKQYKSFNFSQLQNKILRIIYYLLFAWSLISGIEIILAEFTYIWIAYGINQQEMDFNILSKYVFLFAFLILFLFQTALLISIYFWSKSLILFCSRSRDVIIENSQSMITQQMENRYSAGPQKSSDLETKIITIIKLYFVVRIAFLVVWVPFYCLIQSIQTARFLAVVFLYFMLFDSLFSFILLILSAIAIKKKRLQLKKNYFKLSKNIRIMMFPTFFRISMIIINILSPYFDLNNKLQDCELSQEFKFYPYGLMALGGIGIYVFPYFVFIRALHPSSNLSSNSLAQRQSHTTAIFLSK